MRGSDERDEVLDLVRRVLDRKAERVEPDAFLARLNRARRPRRLPAWLIPAAAAAAVTALAVVMVEPTPEPRPSKPVLLALAECGDALRSELNAAAGGARVVGSAAATATAAPLKQLAERRVPVPDLDALNRLWPAETGPAPKPEENAP